jgi:hypothetical protein
MSGMDEFAPYLKINGCFIVMNISPQIKTIKIFNYPIPYLQTRDILQIPGVSESSIRASLLKGELQHKIRANDITVVCSDVDLLQFNTNQKLFLQNAGIVNGLEASGSGGGITPQQHKTLRDLIHFIDEGPGDGFASGAFREALPLGNPFPTSITWYLDVGKTQKLVEKFITYVNNAFPSVITWRMYDTDGTTVIHTVTDSITYSSAFESTRTRTIS